MPLGRTSGASLGMSCCIHTQVKEDFPIPPIARRIKSCCTSFCHHAFRDARSSKRPVKFFCKGYGCARKGWGGDGIQGAICEEGSSGVYVRDSSRGTNKVLGEEINPSSTASFP